MMLDLLTSDDPAMPFSAEERWFLWKWCLAIGLDGQITGSAAKLFNELKFPSHQGREVLTSLKRRGFIEATAVIKGRGRPCHHYQLSEKLIQRFSGQTFHQLPLANEIRHVSNLECSSTTDDASIDGETLNPHSNLLHGSERKNFLTIVNRWFLTVLLAHSDANGNVSSLTHAKLQRLCGLSINRFQSQRRKLVELGFLTRFQKGRPVYVKNSTLFPVYYLNLAHQAFENSHVPVVEFELLPSTLSNGNATVIDKIVEVVFDAEHMPIDKQEKVKLRHSLSEFSIKPLSESQRLAIQALPNIPELTERFRSYVHKAAMSLLNAGWDDLRHSDADRRPSILKELLTEIGRPLNTEDSNTTLAQLFASKDSKNSKQKQRVKDYSAFNPIVFATALYDLSLHLARQLKDQLLKIESVVKNRTLAQNKTVFHYFNGEVFGKGVFCLPKLNFESLSYRLSQVRTVVDDKEVFYWRLVGMKCQEDLRNIGQVEKTVYAVALPSMATTSKT